MSLIGGLAYHLPRRGQRLRFVDLLFVAPGHRGARHAARLLWELRQGPLELSVRKDNNTALRAYLGLGLCTTDSPTYAPDAAHLALRSTSYLRTKEKLEDALGGVAARDRHEGTRVAHVASWEELPKAERRFLVQGAMATEGSSQAAARRLLRGQEQAGDAPDARVRYALLYKE